MTAKPPTAIIADDEPELRSHLKSLLADLWPELKICAEAGNGKAALAAIENAHPRIAFLDIRMPGISGLKVAEAIAQSCFTVFVTAYDAYAVAAFEKQAVDYLLKPITRERLRQTVERLKRQLTAHDVPPPQLAQLARELVDRLAAGPEPKFLQWVRVQRGESIELLPVDDVIYFQAGDKYTAVKTREREALIRYRIRDLAAQLDPDRFWRIHRGTIVNVSRIDRVSRGLTGRGVIRLKDRPETLTVSRTYLHLFRQM